MSHLRTLSLLVATALPLALAACGNAPADPRTDPPLVRVARAGRGAAVERGFTGIVSARVQSDLGFRVTGKVIERLVDAGQTVRRGQPLMRIDATDYVLASTSQAGAVAAAQAAAIQTAADEKRYGELVGAGAVSASAYDKARAAADAARAQLRAAQAQARVARNEAGYAMLVADADGVVVETLAEPGQVVAAGQPVVRLARSGAREAVVSLPETMRPAVGSAARATAFNGTPVSKARLRQLSDAADPQTRTYEARYVLSGPAAAAPLGSTVTIHLAAAAAAPAMEVPLGAILDKGHGPGVWLLRKDATVAWHPVRLSALSEESAVVAGGLRTGDRFVALGAHQLHEGEKVRVSDVKVAAR
ncbi:MAG: efflux transporter, family, subunit [Rhizorhabdus sp.]|nr:efflux transporter, family, subunit [Rhizorhabdus sp.]